MFFTLFKTNGEVIKLPNKEPTPKQVYKILDCNDTETGLIGILFNDKDHHNATYIMDDIAIPKHKPPNTRLSDAMSKSWYWRNVDLRNKNDGRIVICGDVIVATEEELF